MRRETICIQGGYEPKNGEPRQIPIIQSTTFKYDTSSDMAKLFDLEATGYFYTRLQNPTNDFVAKKIAQLEGGVNGMLTSSGQAANFFAIFNICNAGDHFVAVSEIYGGTYNLVSTTMKKMGIECTFISASATEDEIQNAIKENTKLIFGETLSNPALEVLDIEKFAKIAHKNGIPLIIDNTFPTPINCRPLEWGADIITHSTTKYLDGHGVAIGGVLIDGGKFDWNKHKEKFKGLTTPDESYHGIVYTEQFGIENAYLVKATAQLMRDFGAIQSPQHAFYLNLGLESLDVRVKRHCENAMFIAEKLLHNKKIKYVVYPSLPSDKNYELAKKYMPNGTSGVISFCIDGGRTLAEEFMKNLKYINIETHVADARTCCLNPASSTHRQLTTEQLKDAGIDEGMIRLSVGIENKEDLIEDIENALNKI